MGELAGLRAVVHGRVQGVSFRFYTVRRAAALGLTGYVRNLSDGWTVEVVAEGDRDSLTQLLEWLGEGPRGARVERVDVEWLDQVRGFEDFGVRF